jgi:hypothetical protein
MMDMEESSLIYNQMKLRKIIDNDEYQKRKYYTLEPQSYNDIENTDNVQTRLYEIKERTNRILARLSFLLQKNKNNNIRIV